MLKKEIKHIYERTLLAIIKKIRYHFLKNRDFTIISNNCWGGHVYQYFGMQYNSPTIGLTFFADEYLKFASNLKKYLSMDLKFIPKSESRYYRVYKEKKKYYPIGVLGDIEIVFLHYTSEDEAREKWNRRKARMNWDNLIVKFNDMNLATEEHIRRFDKLPYRNKICFVANPVLGTKCTLEFKMYNGFERIENDVTMYRKYLRPIRWLNGLKRN